MGRDGETEAQAPSRGSVGLGLLVVALGLLAFPAVLSPLAVPLPSLLLLAGLVLLSTSLRVTHAPARIGAVLLFAAFNAVYLAWRWTTLPASIWQWVYFAAEAGMYVRLVGMALFHLRRRDNSPRADVLERAMRARPAADLPTVDVLVPTYNEPLDILARTVEAAERLDWPADRLTIWVLDDTRRPWLRDWCARRRGIRYLARADNRGAKAGNLNHALPHCEGEVLLVLDADFAAEPRILYRTVGFLEEPGVGLVQTPQHFINPDPVQQNLRGAHAWADDQRWYFDIYEPAKEGWDNATCVGTGFVTRRAHIDAIGGFPENCITEDFYTSYLLKAKGLRTLYLNEALAWGLNPETLAEYVGQRSRWGQGTLQTLYLPGGPLRARGLGLVDRLFFLEGATFWNNVLGVPILMVAPVLYLLTGLPFMAGDAASYFRVFLPHMVVSAVVTWWLCEGRLMPLISSVTRLITLAVVVPTVLSAYVSPFQRRFRVTLKGQSRDRVLVQWKLIWPFLLLMALTVVGLVLNLARPVIEPGGASFAPLTLALFNFVVFWLCALACVELPTATGPLDTEVPPTRGRFVESMWAISRTLVRP